MTKPHHALKKERFVSQQSGTESSELRPFFSVVVTNWNGSEWLLRCLSSLQLSARRTGVSWEMIVVDDASSDNSVALIEQNFPRVKLLKNTTNKGFGESTNRGVRFAKGQVVVLCNNDLAVKEEFLPRLIRWFQPGAHSVEGRNISRDHLFSVSAQTLSWWDGTSNQSCMAAQLKGGRMNPAYSKPEFASLCLFTQAGAAAYDRIKFLQLRGLRAEFHPGYWEDYDISYRASKCGWINLYDPDALALHHGGGSMTKRFGAVAVNHFKARNHLLFEWMNLASPQLLLGHFLRLSLSLLLEPFTSRELPLTKAFLAALPMIPRVLRERWRNSLPIVSDEELLKLGKSFTAS